VKASELTPADIADLTAFRRALHSAPEVSGAERKTAATVAAALAALAPCPPADIVTGLGGHGVAAVWTGAAPGPTVLFRAELDALPIVELTGLPYASTSAGVAHLCGHDGHTTILLGLARRIARAPLATGRVVLMFQPAEEDGSGAAAVIADPRYAMLAPDWAFALHNMPGVPEGQALLAAGPVNCASLGLKITLVGKTAHAAQPEAGTSPAVALSRLMPGLIALAPGGPLGQDYRLATLTHAVMGVPAFGIAPAQAEVWVTLRTMTDAAMTGLLAEAEALAAGEAGAAGLALTFSHHDIFAACENDPDATAHLSSALATTGISQVADGLPYRFSEDFGRFGGTARAAMVFLGAGEIARLHNPDYDFPDTLIAPGVAVFAAVLDDLLGKATP